MINWGEQIEEDLIAIDARGVLQIQDGTSNTVLISESTGSTASCSADPTTGEPILESLTLLVREPRSKASEFVIVRIVHTAESQEGMHDVQISVGEQVFEGTMHVRSIGRPPGEPAGRGVR